MSISNKDLSTEVFELEIQLKFNNLHSKNTSFATQTTTKVSLIDWKGEFDYPYWDKINRDTWR